MRRLFVLALVLGATSLLHPLATPSPGSETLLAFGIVILGAYAAGELLAGFGLPKLVGYIVAGVAFGPSALNAMTPTAVATLEPISSLAISLIAFLAGAELRWGEVRAHWGTIARILVAELTFSLIAITAFLVAARQYVPFLPSYLTVETIAFSLLFASIAIVHSPAVTMALLTETKAEGPLSRTALGVVLFSDIVVVLLLTAVLRLVRAVAPAGGHEAASISVGSVGWEVGGAVLIGAALGALVALYLRFVRGDLFLFAIVVAFFGGEIARTTHTEPLLLLITAGFVTENISHSRESAALREAMERAAAPVFVVFFALAGAKVAVRELMSFWPVVVPLALVRGAAIWGGCRVGAWWAGLTGPEDDGLRRRLWMGLISQAGVAIGLSAVVAAAYPGRGDQIRDLFLALIAVNETAGAILFRRALARSGEIGRHGRVPAAEVVSEAPP